MKIEDCNGCRLKRNKYNIWTYECPWFDEDMVCPCLDCLVKVMCSYGRRCDLFIRHQRRLQERQYEEKRL